MIRSHLMAVLIALAAGCATRSVPLEISPDAPSSPQAKEAPVGSVTRALEQDPPFGVTATATVSPHLHHGGHHHGH